MNIYNNRVAITWTLVFLLLSILMVKVNYVARENDTRLYTIFLKQLDEKPLSDIIKLEWQGKSVYSEKETPYVRDHLIGQFFVPLTLTKVGIPSSHALYITNTLYKILSIILLYLIATNVFSKKISALTTILVQLTPINFNYLMRANHEPPLLLLVLLIIYACLGLRTRKQYYLLIFICFHFCFLIKGISFLPIIPLTFICYLALNYKEEKREVAKGFLTLSFLSLSVLATAAFYEYLFRMKTGFPFFEQYFKLQVVQRTLDIESHSPLLIQKIKNLTYYSSRLLSYSLPWTLIPIYYLIKKDRFNNYTKSQLNFLAMLVLCSLSYVLIFSTADRLASRYIFPSYYLFSMASIFYFLRKVEDKIKLTSNTLLIISSLTFFILTSINIIRSIDNASIYTH